MNSSSIVRALYILKHIDFFVNISPILNARNWIITLRGDYVVNSHDVLDAVLSHNVNAAESNNFRFIALCLLDVS